MSVQSIGGNPVSPIGRATPAQPVENRTYERQPATEQQAQQEEHAQQPIDAHQLENAVNGLNQMLEVTYTKLQFVFHEKSGQYVVKVKNASTDEVIREIPPEKFLDIITGLKEYMGLLVDEKV